jgi:prepilin-type N-terminal cleavage/methylation domain-containing protein
MGRLHRGTGGFTLIELSIVLVIIGLIVGGILTGQSLIRAAALQSVVTDVTKFSTAVYTFQSKYDNQLPGDMPNATTYWGTNPNCATYGVGTGTQTCDGDGSGIVDNGTAGNAAESVYFWQHLANAGLVAGNFTGAPAAGGPFSMVVGQNVPASRWNSAGFCIYYLGDYVGDINTWASNYGHTFILGNNDPGWANVAPALRPDDILTMDQKIDDGKPGTGKVMTQNGNAGCSTSNDQNTALYNVGYNALACIAIFKSGF